MNLLIRNQLPSADEFCSLRLDTGWGEISLSQAQAALSASLCGVSLYSNDAQNRSFNMGAADVKSTGVKIADVKGTAPALINTPPALIGMARVIGDGVLNLYIQDVIIAKKYRGQGYGARLMDALIAALQDSYPKDCTIGLFAAKGQAPFYERFGFLSRPSAITDAGMNAEIGALYGHRQKQQT